MGIAGVKIEEELGHSGTCIEFIEAFVHPSVRIYERDIFLLNEQVQLVIRDVTNIGVA